MDATSENSAKDTEAESVRTKDSASGRMSVRLAWSLWAVALAVGAASLVLVSMNGGTVTVKLEGPGYLAEILWWDVLVPAAIPAFATVGVFIASRRPENAVGWLCLAVGVSVALVESSWEYAARTFQAAPGSLPAGTFVAWVSNLMNPAMITPLMLLLLVFPNGRLPSRRWRLAVWLVVAATALVALDRAFSPALGVGIGVEIPNPVGLSALEGTVNVAGSIGGYAFLAAFLVSIASVFFRWRRSVGMERLQLKWLAYAGAVAASSALVAAAFGLASGTTYTTALLGGCAIGTVTIGVPASIGVAILRHRLYDIDLVINRTLVYGALTACVVGIYVFVVGYLGTLFRTGDNLAISLLATGVVAVAFQPLRDRLQRTINRLMYGERDEPYEVLSRLGTRLEGTLDPDSALSTIVQTVAQAMKTPHASISLDLNGESVKAAEHGTPKGVPTVLPLSYGGRSVGRLALSPRSVGEEFSASDKRLLEDLARQAGVVARSVQLTADLRRSREEIVTAREEERRRLRRDLHDGLGPRLAAQTLKVGSARSLFPRDPKTANMLLEELERDLDGALADIRRLVYNLRPPALDQLGLAGAIRDAVLQYDSEELRVAFEFEGPDDLTDLPAAVEAAAYRISQEALANVARHAAARDCVVRLSRVSDILELEVSDNGLGIAGGRRAGVGLSSMRERAEELGGTCEAKAAPGGGTRVLARIPLPKVETE